MKSHHLVFGIVLFFLILGLGVSVSPAKSIAMDDEFSEGIYTLEPGMSTSCQNDFIVENAGKDDAEFLMLLGEEEYVKGNIDGNHAKAYSLSQSISTAKMEGRTVKDDDVATIINMGGKSKINLYCVE